MFYKKHIKHIRVLNIKFYSNKSFQIGQAYWKITDDNFYAIYKKTNQKLQKLMMGSF